MQCGAAVFAALLYVDDLAMAAHHFQHFDAIQFGGQMDGCEFFLIENARFDAS